MPLQSPPVEEPVSLNEIVAHLKREDTNEDDEYISSLIPAARELGWIV
jgi:hypothetical protein